MDNGIAALFIPFGRPPSLAALLSATLYPDRCARERRLWAVFGLVWPFP
jgi:hypothetical protein